MEDKMKTKDTTKRKYEKPAMKVYHLQHRQQLLQASMQMYDEVTTEQW